MKAFIENPELLINEFNEMAAIAQKKAFITVGIEIQQEEIKVLIEYMNALASLKKEFVEKKLEHEANLIFTIENSLRVLQYELEMLVFIKQDKMAEAWDKLVDAQVIFGNVVRNYPFKTHSLNGYLERLENYEKLLFPELHFQSTGGIIKESKCSICDSDYDKCEHIKGRLYMGEMCCRIITKMELEEISFVENPANKHCRVLTIETDGKKFDIMTLRQKSTTANTPLNPMLP
jgi:hypothetical protein